MAENKPSGLKPPTKRPTGLVKPSSTKLPPTSAPVPAASKSDLIIGDRVLVSGTKPGRIQYLGETQFAPGQWAGVVLDQPVGKNDGSVAGVQYFQCEPLHGVFARPSKLIKEDKSSSSSGVEVRKSVATPAKVRTMPLTAAALKSMETPKTASKTKSVRSPASSIRSLRLGLSTAPPSGPTDLRLGDRVIVSGNRIGVVRYLGDTEFSSGTWVGVDLVDPLGKNDGSVQGKRYFQCKNLHGLFAPIHKVKKTGSATPATAKVPTTHRRRLSTASSNASLSSLSSIKSSSRASKSLKSEVSSRYQKKTTGGGVAAMQEALKEKQQHVEELLAERDLERAEIMEVQQVSADTKRQLELFKEDHASKESQISSLKTLVEKADEEKVSLQRQLEEEKQKFEDLQFSLEEQQILKDDVQVSGVDNTVLLRDLETSRDEAVARAEEATQHVKNFEVELSNLQLTASGNSDEISERLKQTVIVLQEVEARSNASDKELQQLKTQLQNEEEQAKKLKEAFDDMEKQYNIIKPEKDQLKQTINEMEKLLEDNKSIYDMKIHELHLTNEKLSKENNDLMFASGDNSSQFATLKQSVDEKEKIIKALQAEIDAKQVTNKELQTKLSESVESKKQVEEDLQVLKEENAKTEKKTSVFEAESEKKQQLLQEKDEVLQQLQSEKENLESQMQSLFGQSQKAIEENETINKEKQSLLVVLNAEKQKYQELSHNFEDLMRRHENAESSLNELSQKSGSETQNLILKLQEQETNYSKLQDDFIKVQSIVDQLREDRQKLREELESTVSQYKATCNELNDKLEVELSYFKAESERNVLHETCEQQKKIIESTQQEMTNKINEIGSLVAAEKQLNEDVEKKSQQITELANANDEFKQLKLELENRVNELSDNLKLTGDAKSAECDQLQLKLEENRKQFTEKETDFNDKIKTILEEKERLEQKCSENILTIADLESSKQEISNSLERKIVEFDKVQAQLTTLQKEKQQVDESLNKTNDELCFVQENINKHSIEITHLKSAIEEKDCKLDQSLQEKKLIETSLEETQQKNLSLNDRIKSLENDSSALQGKLALVETTGSDIQEKAKEYLSKIQQLEEEKIKLESDIQRLTNKTQQEIAASKDLINDLQIKDTENNNTIAKLTAEIDTLQLLLEESVQSKQTAESEAAKINQKLVQAEQQVVELNHNLSLIQEEKCNLQKDKEESIKSFTENLDKRDTEISQFKLDLEANAKLHEEARTSLESTQVELKLAVEERDAVKAEQEELKKSYDDLEQMQNSSQEDLQASLLEIKNENESLKQKVQESSDNIQFMTQQLEEATVLKSALQQQLDVIMQEFQSYKQTSENQNECLTSELSQLMDQNVMLQLSEADSKKELDLFTTQMENESGQLSSSLEELKKNLEEEKLKVEQNQNDINQKNKLLEEMQVKLQDQEAHSVAMTNNLQEITSENEKLTKELESISNERAQMQSKVELLETAMKSSQDNLDENAKNNQDIQQQTEELKLKFEASCSEVTSLTEQLAVSKVSVYQLNVQLEQTQSELVQSQEMLLNLEKSLVSSTEEKEELKVQVETLQTSEQESAGSNAKLTSVLHEKNKLSSELDKIKDEFDHTRRNLLEQEEREKSLRSTILILEADVKNHSDQSSRYNDENEMLNELKSEMKTKLDKMEKSVSESEERENVLKREFTRERESLQSSLDITNTIVDEKSREINQYLHEISILKSENVMIDSLKETVNALEMRKSTLEEELMNAVESHSKPSSNNGDSGTASEDQQSQIDFLNSIIVDQQTKVEELNERIKELETMLINGGDVDQSKIANEMATEFESGDKRRAAPRLFCDICDVFDAHETEDCPSQAMEEQDMSGLPQTVHNVSKKGEVRPYCENCEMFGHDTEDCTEDPDEMF